MKWFTRLGLLLSLSSQAVARPAATPTGDAVPALCTQYAYASVDGYDLLNNLWGQDDAESGSQCTYYYGPAPKGGLSWGSSWTWNGNPDNVKSYVYANRQFTRRLLSNITALPTSSQWSYHNKTDMRANVAYDYFTHPDANHTNSNGEYELMIWLHRYDGLGPISESPTRSPVERVELAGYTWDLYFGYNGKMKVYSFLAASDAIYSFNADVMVFFKYLAKNYAFPMSNQYLLINQFGTEALTGQNATFHVSRHQSEVV